MQFELTEALLEDLLFSMEDQEGKFYLDTCEGVIVAEIDAGNLMEEKGRIIDLPEWDSSSGFRLMERFAASFRNPLIRNELTAALNQGRGVFRAFKNTIGAHPEAEKLWFLYKERELKREIIRWYNALREEWGLEKIGFEPEETTDLVLEDFHFREFRNEDRAAIADLQKLNGEEKPVLVAETGEGEFAGFIATQPVPFRKNTHNAAHGALYISSLKVKLEYRGLGIGKALLEYYLKKYKPAGITEIYMDVPVEAEWFSRVLTREGFSPQMTRYCLRL